MLDFNHEHYLVVAQGLVRTTEKTATRIVAVALMELFGNSFECAQRQALEGILDATNGIEPDIDIEATAAAAFQESPGSPFNYPIRALARWDGAGAFQEFCLQKNPPSSVDVFVAKIYNQVE
jgi:hypothetical protein